MICKDLISVIVPVYNVEQYLEKCVKSILKQDYINFELFLVDDGATDSSGEMCNQFAGEDTRIKVIHKQNGGLSDARNVAIDQMKGEYVVFIDSDDYVENNYLSILYGLIKEYDVEISICNFKYISESGILLNKAYNDGEILVLNQKEALKRLVIGRTINTSASMKMYKTSLFEGIRYPKGKLYEDIATTYKLFMKTDKLVYQNYSLYDYLCRTGSITKQGFTPKRLDAIENMLVMCEAIKEKYSELGDICDARIYSQYISTYSAALSGNADKTVINRLYQEMNKIRYNKCFKKKMKIYYKISKMGKTLFDSCILAEEYIQNKRKLGM